MCGLVSAFPTSECISYKLEDTWLTSSLCLIVSAFSLCILNHVVILNIPITYLDSKKSFFVTQMIFFICFLSYINILLQSYYDFRFYFYGNFSKNKLIFGCIILIIFQLS